MTETTNAGIVDGAASRPEYLRLNVTALCPSQPWGHPQIDCARVAEHARGKAAALKQHSCRLVYAFAL
ncbi:hypothetical protein [Mycobacterium sp. E1747]|uniref:hypothetical protein n=1 Tax=Mycobacterium sp. E1747 TaxID=1834128 RepID=UPI000ADFFA22|nr:hypothetical protein [Mycobacterium sp. E1747]